MTNQQCSVERATVVPQLPQELWLLLASYADARAILCLCATDRAFWRTLANAQRLWRQLYYATFSGYATEVFWLAVYRARLAKGTEIGDQPVDINWRRAVVARRQTEMNWRLGRSTVRSCFVPESQGAESDWVTSGFTPYELLLRSCNSDMPYTVPVTAVDTREAPLLIQLDDASDEEQSGAYIYTVGDHCVLLSTRQLQSGTPLWARRLTGGSTQRLAQGGSVIDRRGRWALVYQSVYGGPGDRIPLHRLLLDMNGQYPPCRLKMLETFDFEEYRIDSTVDVENEQIERQTLLGQSYPNAYFLAAHDDRVVLFAINGSKTRLYWKVLEVTFGSNSSAGGSTETGERTDGLVHSHVRTVHTGCCLNAWGANLLVNHLRACALDGSYIYARGRDNCSLPVINFVVNVRHTSGAVRALEGVGGARENLRIFRHGWVDCTTQRFIMRLTHRRVLVVTLHHNERQRGDGWPVRLLHFDDGSVVASYSLPDNDTAKHVLGDLALLATHNGGDSRLLLFDMFAGVTVRVIHGAVNRRYVNSSLVSPVYIFAEWKKGAAQHTNKKRHSISWLLPFGDKGPLVRRLCWLDFMPSTIN
ncbi:hypothetical protein THASP1DRAFT_33371 [Thamnocephalis sphaerospora]|uniref:F-box domain-containing protein n=1 Tax=Thamnocephalis sphaerospora TaxID=78915 RepID=A0A4P9XGT8_9FUNG|nr:hypothetical protein THASP1DRAFT_33371 [Thamnocephalis sphaerospora]|eukprot:RKP04818.1 hypothetical protein THASP1DRAFT_33371 [Thamnocephalis sphaerospora]